MSPSSDYSDDSVFHEFDLDAVMGALASKGRIFNSEASFQFELAWKIKEMYPTIDVRLEEVFSSNPDMHFDIVLHSGDFIVPIELKYCTKKYVDPERGIYLKNHGAEDIRRYDFIKDIMRIESLRTNVDGTPNRSFCRGFAVFLTNSPSYWKKPRSTSENTCDQDFRINEGRQEIGGDQLKWKDGTKQGTMKGRESPLTTDKYGISWKDYLKNPVKFRYLSIEVDHHSQLISSAHTEEIDVTLGITTDTLVSGTGRIG